MPLVTVPHLPGVSLNRMLRSHWSVRDAERQRWAKLMWAHGGSRAARLAGPVEVWIVFHWPDRRRHDADNAAKVVLDAAVACGLIPDDGPPWLLWTHLASRHDSLSPRTEFRYEAADAPAWPLPKSRAPRRRAGRVARTSDLEAPSP